MRSFQKLALIAGTVALAGDALTLQPAEANRFNWQNALNQGTQGLRVLKNAAGAVGPGLHRGGSGNSNGSGSSGNPSYDAPPVNNGPSTPEPTQDVHGEVRSSPGPDAGYNPQPSNNSAPAAGSGSSPTYMPTSPVGHAPGGVQHRRHGTVGGYTPAQEAQQQQKAHNVALVHSGVSMPLHNGHQPPSKPIKDDVKTGAQASIATVGPQQPEAKAVDTAWCTRVMERSAVAFKPKSAS